MKRPINVIFGAMLVAFASVPAAWAGSAASVTQEGSDNYSIVHQQGDKTQVQSWTATRPVQKAVSNYKVAKAANRAVTGGVKGRAGGSSCGGFGGLNSTFVSQAGFGNSALTSQKGGNNVAGTVQDGNGNTSYIVQKGNGHEAYAEQYGNGNTSLIVQRC